jgi:hypothetical protein
MSKRFFKIASSIFDSIFLLKTKEGNEDGTNGPSWKFRRKLIYGSYRLGFAMIVFGAITYSSDTAVGSGLVAGEKKGERNTCHNELIRVYSSVSVTFSGSGFYSTDK